MTGVTVIVANRGTPVRISLPNDARISAVIRGKQKDLEVVNAPSIRSFVLTPISSETWRAFVASTPDHPALLSGDLFAAPSLEAVVFMCRLAPPRSNRPPFVFGDFTLQEAA